jgi:segregation and condensation protein B
MEDTNTHKGAHKELALSAILEALLFYFAEPVSLKKLSQITKWDIDAIRRALVELDGKLRSRESGIIVIVHNDEASLGTAPEASAMIEAIAKEELSKELSKASLETLSIVCYKGPITRADIDYVRGVNSTFILRNLQTRGIVEKLENPMDSRAALYAPTMQAMQYMGVARREDLPRFDEVQEQLSSFLAEREVETGAIVQGTTESPRVVHGALDSERAALAGPDATDSVAIVCDTNGDGIMTSEECETAPAANQHIGHEGQNDLSRDADIAEEDLMAPAYLDEDVEEHLKKDEERAEHDRS